jgi:hypothetical protein
MRTRRPVPATRLFVALAAALAFGSAAQAQGASTATPAASTATTPATADTGAQRTLAPFTRIRMEGSIDVDAHAGAHPGAVIHAPSSIIPLVETVVSGDTLIVRMKHDANVITIGHGNDLRVELEYTQLTGAQQHGSGDLHVTGLNVPQFESQIAGSGDLKLDNAQLGKLAVSIAGSGDVTADGKADEAKFSIAGSGDITADHLVSRRVAVDIRGSGDARVNATDALQARVAGSGDVLYRGHPHDVARSVAGSGSVEAAD